MKDQLILRNKESIEIEGGSSLSDMRVVSGSMQDVAAVWDKLTNDNLKTVKILGGEGTVIGEYENLILDSETSTQQKDGIILTSFRLREKTEIEILQERVEQLEREKEVVYGAIDDLGAVTSALAEAQDNTQEGGLA